MPKIVLYTDGGARNNPGPAGCGWVMYEGDPSDSGRPLTKSKKYIGEQTNNFAEYEAVVLALTEAKKRGFAKREIEVRLDSELIAKQMSGDYQVKEETLWPQYMKVHNLLVANFPQHTFVHVRREQNKEADALVNEAIDRGR